MFLVPPIGFTKKKGIVLPSFVGISSNGLGSGNSSIQPGLPSYQSGDLLVLIFGGGADSAATPTGDPSGYTSEGNVSNNNTGDGPDQLYLWTRIATGSESNPSISLSGGAGYKVAALLSFRNHGVSAGGMPNVVSSLGGSASFFNTAAAMQGDTSDGAIRLMAWWVNRNGSSALTNGVAVTAPANSTSRLERVGSDAGDNPSTGDRGLFIFTGERPTIGTGTLSVSGFQGASDKGANAIEATVEIAS